MSNYQLWDENRGKIKSKKGGWRIGSKVESHGYDLINELVGNFSYMQVVILNATGKTSSRPFADWLEAAFICMSWPDPRIWCNRIGALGGSAGARMISSVCGGSMAADSRNYGTGTMPIGVEFIQHAYRTINEQGFTVEQFVDQELKKCKGRPNFMGYARPVAKGDERIVAMEAVAKKLNLGIGGHLCLAYKIEEVLMQRFDETMNLNGYTSAVFSDNGFSSSDVYRMLPVLVSSGVAASYVDFCDQDRGAFSPITVDDITYHGVENRKLLHGAISV